jgi:hypothetical protein
MYQMRTMSPPVGLQSAAFMGVQRGEGQGVGPWLALRWDTERRMVLGTSK